jgi:hypothetical protein
MKREKLSLHVTPKPEPQAPVHPIVEVSDAPRGWTEIKIRDSRGNRIGFFQASAADMDDELADAFRAWQARHAHEPSLGLVGES